MDPSQRCPVEAPPLYAEEIASPVPWAPADCPPSYMEINGNLARCPSYEESQTVEPPQPPLYSLRAFRRSDRRRREQNNFQERLSRMSTLTRAADENGGSQDPPHEIIYCHCKLRSVLGYIDDCEPSCVHCSPHSYPRREAGFHIELGSISNDLEYSEDSLDGDDDDDDDDARSQPSLRHRSSSDSNNNNDSQRQRSNTWREVLRRLVVRLGRHAQRFSLSSA